MAFNIDVEVGPHPNNAGEYRFNCASLTEEWNVDKNADDVERFSRALIKADAVNKGKIRLPRQPHKDNMQEIEIYLSSLGCSPDVLKIPLFQYFLDVPKAVKDGLAYIEKKPIGSVMRHSWLNRHASFVRRGADKRYIKLTNDERGGSVLAFLAETDKNPIANLKLGASTQISRISEIPNGFVLKSGKRQWILQAASQRELTSYLSSINTVMGMKGAAREAPQKKKKTSLFKKSKSDKPEALLDASGAPMTKTQKKVLDAATENDNIQGEIMRCREQIAALAKDIEVLESGVDELKSSFEEVKEKEERDFEEKEREMGRKHAENVDRLILEIQELHRKNEEKALKEGTYEIGSFGAFKEDNVGGGGEGYGYVPPNAGGGAAAASQQAGGDVGGGNYTHTYKHLHKHKHLHIMMHKHTHNHDDTVDYDSVFTQTLTIAHTVTHTTNQYQIKKHWGV